MYYDENKEKRMLRIENKTKLSQEEVIKQALKFFGGLGMKVRDQSPTCIYFEGSGGTVDVVTSAAKGVTTLEIVSKEWDNFVKTFMETLPKKVT